MRCFVASALGYPEVDRVYDKIIRPVLREVGVQPVRIDRIEHNREIDDKIIALIERADLCIADLTYARPSVYYEAGYACGLGKVVVYIVRQDHFTPKSEDKAGNLRVHFDLQMKNIIKWEPTDTLQRRLKNRLVHVLRPLQRKEKKAKDIQLQAREFGLLALNTQLANVTNKGRTLLSACGFRERPFKKTLSGAPSPRDARLYRAKDGIYQQIYLMARQSISKSQLSKLSQLWWLIGPTTEECEEYSKFRGAIIIAALRPVRSHTLAAALPDGEPLTERVFKIRVSKMRADTDAPMIAVIDQIKSVDDFAERLRDVLGESGFV